MIDSQVVLYTPRRAPVLVHVEVPQTEEELATGLAGRRRLATNEGMLFVLPRGTEAMWMRNTLIPLDMIFADASGTVLAVVESAPPNRTEPRYAVGDARYVLEVAAGFARHYNVGRATRLELPREVTGS